MKTEAPVDRAPRQVIPVLVAGATALLIGAGLGAAGFAVFDPGRSVDSTSGFVLATVDEGEVGSEISLNTVASWNAVPLGVNRRAGVVTSIAVADGDELKAGGALYSVDLRPVVVAQGSVPSFRDLSSGATGADVVQLQLFLAKRGYLSGAADGRFGSATARAVRDWQHDLGLRPDGVVLGGDLVYLPTLPARIVLDRKLLVVGASLGGGEKLVSGLSGEPVFTIPITDTQARLIDLGMRVDISAADGHKWTAAVGDITIDDEGATIVHLAAAEGDSICAPDCGILSPVEETLLTSRVIVVEPVSGLRVPTAAIQTRADQSTFVTDVEGTEHDVDVKASAQGMSIVDGVEAGLSVRVLGSRQ